MNALPAILWLVGALGACAVCAVTIVESHYFDHKADEVRPVAWSMIGAHFITLIMLAIPYPIFLANKNTISEHSRELYERLGWVSAGIAIALILLELVLMYLQARRAMIAQEAHDDAQAAEEDADTHTDTASAENHE